MGEGIALPCSGQVARCGSSTALMSVATLRRNGSPARLGLDRLYEVLVATMS
jgi:hypothetical protein